MVGRGLILATTISVLFWLLVIFIVKIGLIHLSTIIFAILFLLGLLLFLILRSNQQTKIKFPCYEVRHIGDHEWQTVSEIKAMEKLVDYFYPVTPVLSRILKGEEIILLNQVYRLHHH